MGLIDGVMGAVFGGGRNAIVETVEAFRENAEKGAARDAGRAADALEQFASEFTQPRQSVFDIVIDGLNRIPRPAMAFGTLALFGSAMVDPVWFATRMAGLALVPEPLWWLLGAIVSFYFGARHQAKSQEFQRSIADTLARAPAVTRSIETLRGIDGKAPPAALPADDPEIAAIVDGDAGTNAALAEWRQARG